MEEGILKKIKAKMTAKKWSAMQSTARDGDVEWASDMMDEVIEGIKPGSTFYIKGYHSIFKQFTKEELEQAKEEWFKMYYPVEDPGCSPAGEPNN